MVFMETSVTNLACAASSIAAGARSVELCSASAVGGVTPSLSLARDFAALPHPDTSTLTVLVRVRDGDFFYTASEKECMISDVSLLQSVGVTSVAVGSLLPPPPGSSIPSLDVDFLNAVHDLGVEVTLHRACDDLLSRVPPSEMDEEVSSLVDAAAKAGVTRILTSGGMPTALEGLSTIKKLANYCHAHYPIVAVVAAAGVDVQNVSKFVEAGVEAVHVGSGVRSAVTPVGGGGLSEGQRSEVDSSKVSSILSVLSGSSPPPMFPSPPP